ncbi:Ribonuclease P protein subunit-like protein [Hapsidospora chrysogenum ATCC 11550]|uniref:Ribonuclease P protein subunit-like protein n=1 Tax=Hapsidospora chrysogenum (strain ATCC 11550 / CBS 779.69 / DSM 880 / IAM 14645 / JCM 23072 / IMI 49137) TaxID=857340 RepID=A0A086T2J8_HAPC1|nr:Ribonuclease P protein subunit-like protein [Hapsidospora chrysogenum ATCC 11550]
MAKPKAQASVPNRHIYTRASYLYQAANYLARLPERQDDTGQPAAAAAAATAAPGDEQHSTSRKRDAQGRRAAQNISRRMVSDLRAVSLKGQVRQSPAMKRSMCKFCDTVLIEGRNCHSVIENESKGARKPWADVLVIRCSTCGNSKRFPVSARRQQRKHLRQRSPHSSNTAEQAEAGDLTPNS